MSKADDMEEELELARMRAAQKNKLKEKKRHERDSKKAAQHNTQQETSKED